MASSISTKSNKFVILGDYGPFRSLLNNKFANMTEDNPKDAHKDDEMEQTPSTPHPIILALTVNYVLAV
ncbi:hypothetical protein CEXT_282261 [Caerostris extrusa]|uniref:Uncharacterized protein n=1 Tax=Caerostris extrusa TaxID=172846 RepID=A0AAV4W8N7_CAEEX|nr:hypothetical protein CEXT_282261 [Caerostris extrusa]